MHRKIKICIIVPTHWSKRMGGAQFQVKCLIEALLQLDQFDIFFLARNINNYSKLDRYRLIQISVTKGVTKLGFFIDTFPLLKLLYKIKPDVIYQRVGCAYTGIAAFYAQKNRCKMIWHIAHDHDVQPFKIKTHISPLYPFRYINHKFLEYGINNSQFIVAQTKQQGMYLKHYYKREPTVVIRNFHPLPKDVIKKNYPIKVVWVANFKRWKQPEYFIQLAEDLSKVHNNVTYTMIGEPCPKERVWQKSLEHRIDQIEVLEYMGKQSIEEVNRILSESHIFVNTSISEGFANTFIQAWMRKVPIVSLSCNPDGILNDGNIGFYAGNYESMLTIVDLLIREHSLREEMGRKSQQYAFNEHSFKNIDSLVNIFKG